MSLNAVERVSILIRCRTCGEATQKPLTRLVAVNRLACPHCANVVDLESGEDGALIQGLADQCRRIDAGLAKGRKR